jgi:hypothetical protein
MKCMRNLQSVILRVSFPLILQQMTINVTFETFFAQQSIKTLDSKIQKLDESAAATLRSSSLMAVFGALIALVAARAV